MTTICHTEERVGKNKIRDSRWVYSPSLSVIYHFPSTFLFRGFEDLAKYLIISFSNLIKNRYKRIW